MTAISCHGRSDARSLKAAGVAVAVGFVFLGGELCHAEAVVETVNPPEFVSPELKAYVDQFEAALRGNGFRIATAREPRNLDLRLSLATGPASITITSELLQSGRTLVATPVINRTFHKQSAIAGTVTVAAQRFSRDVARYVESVGGAIRVSGSPSAQPASSSQADGVASSQPTVQREVSRRADEVYDAILKLEDLRKRGLLTDEEFNAEKQKVLSGD
jgi:hypothetical protein